ncbi:MAG: pseudouridine synthase [Chloroflexota bacterium]
MEHEGERLQKALAAAGVASRRHAEELIQAGRVEVNGAVVTRLGTRVGPRDRVAVDGKLVSRVPLFTYIVLNKPVGIVSTARDERGRRTVVDLVKAPVRVYPVGRLDATSEGLILLTNHGDLTFRLLHPRHEVPREYHVWVSPPPTAEQLERLRGGVEIEGWRTGPAEVTRGPGGALRIVIHEGHKRQIRLMCQAVGLNVERLVRVRLGPLELGRLKPGEWRELRPAEVKALFDAVGLEK